MSGKLVTKSELEVSQMMASQFFESGLFPDIKAAAQAWVKIQAGSELNIQPFASLTGIHIIKGKPTLSSNAIAALIKSHPDCDYIVEELTDEKCTLSALHRKTTRVPVYEIITNSEGEKQAFATDRFTNEETWTQSISHTFTLEDARKAGTTNLQKFPRNMLFARCISNLAKWEFPHISFAPIYTPEEMENVIEAEEIAPITPKSEQSPKLTLTKIEETKENITIPKLPFEDVEGAIQWGINQTGLEKKAIAKILETIPPDNYGRKSINFFHKIQEMSK